MWYDMRNDQQSDGKVDLARSGYNTDFFLIITMACSYETDLWCFAGSKFDLLINHFDTKPEYFWIVSFLARSSIDIVLPVQDKHAIFTSIF